jgi:hypothetical protein
MISRQIVGRGNSPWMHPPIGLPEENVKIAIQDVVAVHPTHALFLPGFGAAGLGGSAPQQGTRQVTHAP